MSATAGFSPSSSVPMGMPGIQPSMSTWRGSGTPAASTLSNGAPAALGITAGTSMPASRKLSVQASSEPSAASLW